jgi:hypothetical protein
VEPRGAYTAERVAALSGVPKSTVHYWARKDILVPSVSPERVKLWSYGDLMALRTIYWLRQTKQDLSGREVPRTAMKTVRRALREIAALELDLWGEDGAPRVAVDRSGSIVIEHAGQAQRPGAQSILDADMLDLLAPFASHEGLHGPDLSAPRPRLRIVPGKLGGSPHVVHTRLESQALGALADSGLGQAKIYQLYRMSSRPRSRMPCTWSANLHRTCAPPSQHERARRSRDTRLPRPLGGELTGEVILNRLFVSKQRLQRDLCLEHLPGPLDQLTRDIYLRDDVPLRDSLA